MCRPPDATPQFPCAILVVDDLGPKLLGGAFASQAESEEITLGFVAGLDERDEHIREFSMG